MGFKETIQGSPLTKDDRAILFAIKMFAANSIIPGMVLSPDGTKPDLQCIVGLKRIKRLVLSAQLHGIVKMVHSIIVFPAFAEEHEVEYRVEGFEMYRKSQGYRKNKFPEIAEEIMDLLCVDDDTYDEVINFYENNRSGRKWDSIQTVKDLNFDNQPLVLKYLLRFSTKNQFNQGEVSNSKRAVDAMKELKRMLTSQTFHYNGAPYETSKYEIYQAMEKMSVKEDVYHLKNNNYLKVILQKESGLPDQAERNRAAVEGY